MFADEAKRLGKKMLIPSRKDACTGKEELYVVVESSQARREGYPGAGDGDVLP